MIKIKNNTLKIDEIHDRRFRSSRCEPHSKVPLFEIVDPKFLLVSAPCLGGPNALRGKRIGRIYLKFRGEKCILNFFFFKKTYWAHFVCLKIYRTNHF